MAEFPEITKPAKRKHKPASIEIETGLTVPASEYAELESVTYGEADICKPPHLDALMKQHGIKWDKHNGKRVLVFPVVSQEIKDAVYDAIRNG